jgi:serine/threonine protein kinase
MSEFNHEEELFDAARRLANPRERDRFLDKRCAGNGPLRQRLAQLLAALHESDDYFRPVSSVSAMQHLSATSTPEREGIGTRIGRYQLLEKIGEGGFGDVYVADQTEPVKRRVALKVIKPGMDTRQVVARFEAERQALAMMDHPNIAKVHDGGATEAGRPYFVMELVGGVPITKHCDEHKLSIRERLELFVQVCQAVQHAHQKGIIHRDLKPSNILVTVNDGVPVPKVIDFGVAKATQQELTEKTIVTQLHQFIGTPAYMSPEQAEMTSMNIDTRSDIYSLGVLLYELLTGKTPFDGRELLASGPDEMRRTIREKEPVKPSTRLKHASARNLPTKWPAASRKPQIDADLDCIVMKCLEKERTRRYETASGLAADIQHHLDNEPVNARPPSAAYHLGKAIRRHKLRFAAAMAILLALISGIVTTSWQAVRASREKARAERGLTATLKFVEIVFKDVSQRLQALIGGADASATLNTNGFLLMEELQRDARGNPQFDFALGKIYSEMALAGGTIGANSTGNYEIGLNAATQAIRLFVQAGPNVSQDERAGRIARAEMAAGFAARGLRHHEEALAHFREMGRWGQLLAGSSNSDLSAHGATMQRWAVGCTGEEFEALGQTEKAIREHYLPLMKELQRRNVSEQSKKWEDLIDLQGVSASLGRAFNKIGRFDEAEPQLRQWHRVVGLLMEQRPNRAQFAAEHALAAATLGRFLLARGSTEGLQHLEAATNAIQGLVVKDRANATFAENRIKIAKLCALGFADWSADGSVPLAERQRRADNAQRELERAEGLLARLPFPSLRPALDEEMEEARTKVAAARAQLLEPGQPSGEVLPDRK